MFKVTPFILAIFLISSTALIGGCGTTNSPSLKTPSNGATSGTAATQQSQAAVGAASPAGDIPDNQAFVTYTSSSGNYELVVPEGWARSTKGSDVSFQSKYDGVLVAVTKATTPPTVASVKNNQAAELQKKGNGVSAQSVSSVNLPGGPAVLITYNSNSAPDPVTGKQVRQENRSYLFYKNGELATLTLWAPQGADNVDQWNKMAASFKWR